MVLTFRVTPRDITIKRHEPPNHLAIAASFLASTEAIAYYAIPCASEGVCHTYSVCSQALVEGDELQFTMNNTVALADKVLSPYLVSFSLMRLPLLRTL